MVKKYRFVSIVALFLFLALALKGGQQVLVSAQGSEHKYYFPLIFKAEPTRLDDFEDQDPVWTILNMKGADDDSPTFFEYRWGRLYCKIKDNSDRWIIHPNWRTLGDFKLEVDARFLWKSGTNPPAPQTYSGLGMVFGGSDDWFEGYGFMIGFGGAQHSWAITRFDGQDKYGNAMVTNLSKWGGAPSFVRNWDNWNHLKIVRVQDNIFAYANGYRMPMPPPYYDRIVDGKYGTSRLVGLSVTSWEWSSDEIEFDNFKLTPLSMPY